MAKVGSITIDVKPTVTLESAVACVVMLNMFLEDNEDYRLELDDDGKWHLTDEPLVPATGGIYVMPSVQLSDEDKERLDSMPALNNLFEQMGARFE